MPIAEPQHLARLARRDSESRVTDLSTEDWELRIGEQLRRARIAAGLDQSQLADLAGISIGALRNLERGTGSTVKSLVRVARSLDREDWLGAIAPAVSVSPIDILRSGGQQRTRVYRARGPRDGGESRAALMAYQPVDAVEVTVWGMRVGAVARDPASGYYAFEYYADWIGRGIELAPLAMPAQAGVWVFPALPPATFHRLPSLLADSLPDDFGNALIDAWLAAQGVRRGDVSPLDRLAYLASRAMGALEFRPSRGPRYRIPSAIELGELVEGARRMLGGAFAGDRETEAALHSLIQVGTSAGGARAKAVIAWNRESGQIRSGQLPADPGFEYWLIKLDGVGRDSELGAGESYGRIEYAYSLMARAAGIDMTECRLLEENHRAHFMTKRFDRSDDGTKHHAITLCDLAEIDFRVRGANDYAQLFQVLDDLDLDVRAREQVFRRMAFNVLARNCDDHTKNHSFLLDGPDSKWRLSPAYDVTFAYNPNGEWTYQHLMAVNGKFSDITRADLLAVADRFRVPRPRALLAEVAAAITGWERFAEEAGLSSALAAEIRETYEPLD